LSTDKLSERPRLNRFHAGLAAAVLLVTFIIYNATKAPTLSFWDCGEFIACSYTLGIPHPPGAPLYILLGRIFSIIPFHVDIAARVNMLSAMTGAVAAMMAFLLTFKMIRYWWSAEEFTGWKRAIAYIGALVASSMFAFGRTHWNNSMEAEVYTPAMLLVTVMIWLLLRWMERRDEPKSDAYLILMSFLGFLSIGIHMTAFLFMPVIFIAVILFSNRLRRDPFFYITGIVLFTISFSLDVFIYACAMWLVILLIGTFTSRRYAWKFSLLIFAAAIIGYSAQLYTPIRSSQDPSINQNDPSSSVTAFKRFLERKQYGSELMAIRALKRRGEWANQLGTHERMGFWSFFWEQYGINHRAFAFLFVLGLLGMFELARRRPKIGWPFILMIVLGTVFLVWYMNFADGTKQDPVTGAGHIEVRDRDYFFTPGFVLFGMAVGLGAASLMEMARDAFSGKFRSLRSSILAVMTLGAVILMVRPVTANWYYCDRSENYIPYDFAYNLLVSCDPNALLFNGGDNDTFPIWCLQEVYLIRPDVSSVNLALSNAKWYIRQVRDDMGVPLRWTDGQIEQLNHGIGPDGSMVRIQDQVLDQILTVNQWQRPINFALTIGTDALRYRGRSLQNNVILQGLVYRLEPSEHIGNIDMERNRDLYWNGFLFRSLADTNIYKDERTRGLAGNYTTALILMADSLRKTGQFEEAIDAVRRAIEIVPFDYQAYGYLAQLYAEAGQEEKIPDLLEITPRRHQRDIYYVWGIATKFAGDRTRAKEILKKTLELFPTFRDAFREYSLLLYEDNQMDELRETVRRWLLNNPEDDQARRIMEEMFKAPARSSGDDSSSGER
jgi:tetratricopeptide (TPR) repeat protein